MPDIHLIQWTAAFVAALYLTSKWLLDRPPSLWRHLLASTASVVCWILVAYTAGNVAVESQGEVLTFGSDALGTFATFMVVVNVAGLLVGLVLWAEEEAEKTEESLPEGMQHRPGD